VAFDRNYTRLTLNRLSVLADAVLEEFGCLFPRVFTDKHTYTEI